MAEANVKFVETFPRQRVKWYRVDLDALKDPTPVTIDWGSITGKPSTFPPAAHTHRELDVIFRVSADFAIPSHLCVEGQRVTVLALADLNLSAESGTVTGEASVEMFEGESFQLSFTAGDWIGPL